MEPLIDGFGKDLVISAAFINAARNNLFNMSPHGTGEGVDIYVDGWDLNSFLILGEAIKMLKNTNVCEIGLCFNQRSWIHIGIISGNHVLNKNVNNIRYFTRDFVTGQAWSGIYPARGLMR